MTGVTAAGFSSVVRGGFNNNTNHMYTEKCAYGMLAKKELKGGEHPPHQPTQDKQRTYMYTRAACTL